MISDADLLTYLRAPDEDLETLRRLEKAAIALLQKRTGKYLGPEDEITEYVSWRSFPILQLANEPIDGELTSFKSWDGSAFTDVDATSYYVQGSSIYWNSRTNPWTPLTMPARYQVVYTAGYAQLEDPNEWDAPEDIKQAVILTVGHWYENREAVVVGDSHSGELPLAVSALIDGHVKVAI